MRAWESPARTLPPERVDLTLLDYGDGWYTLGRAGVAREELVVQTEWGPMRGLSTRLEPTACVEGTRAEWLVAMECLEGVDDAYFTRLAVEHQPDGSVALFSPRNSNGRIPTVDARSATHLAREIRRILLEGGEAARP